MNQISLAVITAFSLISFVSKAQNAPFSLWGTGLDGSIYQQSVFYSDAINGLLIEAPLNSLGAKLPISFSWRGGGYTPLVLHPNGNVGIGIASPSEKLEISGNTKISDALFVSGIGNNGIGTIHLNSPNGFTSIVARQFDQVNEPEGFSTVVTSIDATNNYLHLGGGLNEENAATGIYFYTAPDVSTRTGSIKMVVNSAGKVGIGTTNPDELLAVDGTIHSKEVRVNLSGLPDYVFKPNYHLPTLSEIKTYIDKHQHLPEIPSAQEVEKNGLNLGEMNRLLLKKVEELTLYLIEKDKQIGDLQQKQKIIQTQQSQIEELRQQMKILLKQE